MWTSLLVSVKRDESDFTVLGVNMLKHNVVIFVAVDLLQEMIRYHEFDQLLIFYQVHKLINRMKLYISV